MSLIGLELILSKIRSIRLVWDRMVDHSSCKRHTDHVPGDPSVWIVSEHSFFRPNKHGVRRILELDLKSNAFYWIVIGLFETCGQAFECRWFAWSRHTQASNRFLSTTLGWTKLRSMVNSYIWQIEFFEIESNDFIWFFIGQGDCKRFTVFSK